MGHQGTQESTGSREHSPQIRSPAPGPSSTLLLLGQGRRASLQVGEWRACLQEPLEPSGTACSGRGGGTQSHRASVWARFTPSPGGQTSFSNSQGHGGQRLSDLPLLLRHTWGILQIAKLPQLSSQPRPMDTLIQETWRGPRTHNS